MPYKVSTGPGMITPYFLMDNIVGFFTDYEANGNSMGKVAEPYH